jgi:hypothetical protein
MSDRTHSNRKSVCKHIETIEEEEKDADADEPEQSIDDLFDQ